MKIKILSSIAFVALAIIAGCSKDEKIMTGGGTNDHLDNDHSRKQLPDFNYVLTKSPEGEYSCPEPKEDCTKIKPNPAGITPVSAPDLIDEAIAVLSPEFRQQYMQGAMRLVLDTNSLGDIFVIGVPGTGVGIGIPGAVSNDFSMDSVLFAVMFPRQ